MTGVDAGCIKETSADPNGNFTEKVYDKAGRLATVIADNKTTTYSYFDNGNRKSVVYPDSSREDYTYYKDNLNRTLTNKRANGSQIDAYSYTLTGHTTRHQKQTARARQAIPTTA